MKRDKSTTTITVFAIPPVLPSSAVAGIPEIEPGGSAKLVSGCSCAKLSAHGRAERELRGRAENWVHVVGRWLMSVLV